MRMMVCAFLLFFCVFDHFHLRGLTVNHWQTKWRLPARSCSAC